MPYRLDLKDKKLLYELELNSRQSFNELAKKIGLSKNSVSYRIKQLQDNKIIKQFHAVVDVGKLGYINFRLYINIENATPFQELEIIDYFVKHPLVTQVVSIDGQYNLGCTILTRSVKEMNDLWKEVLTKYINFIGDRSLAIITRMYYFSKAYLLDLKENKNDAVFLTEQIETRVDEVDIKILKLLAENARIPVIDLAEKLDLTPKTIIARIKELEKNKIIVGYKTVLDNEKLGYQDFRISFRLDDTTPKRIKDFRFYTNIHPNIVFNNEVLGGDDFEIDVQVKGLPEMREVVRDIKSKFSDIIQSYKILHFIKEHEYEFFPLS